MPSLMQHLAVARFYYCLGTRETAEPERRPEPSPLYWVGSIAPDAVYEREAKDRSHLRSSTDRPAALAKIAVATDPAKHFAEAALLHLFVDWKWDEGPQRAFIEHYGDGWFRPYREEIGRAGAWMYHNADWARGAWHSMAACEPSAYGQIDGATPENIRDLITRNGRWLEDNARLTPGYYALDALTEFTRRTAEEYLLWRREHPPVSLIG